MQAVGERSQPSLLGSTHRGVVDPKWKNNGRKANPASVRKCSFPVVRQVIQALTQTWQKKTGAGQERSASFPLGPGSA